ncbi:protein HASTY 1 isoform X2 [Physcomitrium patens]|uniref:protein HASTY 1 isoform X2 n=1 Tax=Physcomitrium patens TaxID=3218 RepID=UPI000D156E24|nr:protein HASTY 1-like isoform X2 [Physcomitrium patens]|eukprot:XP_024381271.1 protein HASTY 1-like isoform X2 [Physcomitrella patens]
MEDQGVALQVETAGQAVLAALNWNSSPEARQQALAYLESLKAGEVHVLATVAFALVTPDQSSEVRLVGLKLLQHMVRMRWENLNADERRQMAAMAAKLLEESAKPNEPWVLKSQVAALMAEIARREGPSLWNDILPALYTLGSSSALHAELVATFFRWLPEDVTIHNEDLDGERRSQLLQGLSQTLPETLPFLYKMLDHHFGAAMAAAKQNQIVSVTQHASAVTAALNAVVPYAEWAPVVSLANYGLVQACGFLLSAAEFRLSACEVFKLLAGRRRPLDESVGNYNVAMEGVFDTLCNVSKAYFSELSKRAASGEGEDEDVDQFGECLCEAMVAFGLQNLHCVARNSPKVTDYLNQMLCFLQHPKLALHSLALPLWTTLLRESSLAMSTTDQQGLTEKEKEKRSHAVHISPDFCAVLLDVAFQRLLIKDGGDTSAEDESGIQEFSSANDFRQFRSRLVELVRHVAAQQPRLATSKAAERLQMTISSSNYESVSSKEITALETTQTYLENILNGIQEKTLAAALATTASSNELRTILEDILQLLLSVKWNGPALVELHTRHFDAMSPYFKHASAAIPLVVGKFFDLLTSLPVYREYGDTVKDTMRARLQVCTSFLRLARAGDAAMLPYMQGIAETMTTLHREGRMVRSELNLLGESLLIVGSAAGGEQQLQVLGWLFGPMQQQWIQPAWQDQYLANPASLVRLFTENSSNDDAHAEMWSIYHTVNFFERALRRCANPSGKTYSGSSATVHNVDMDGAVTPASSHAMIQHLTWMVSPLLKLLRCIHALWSPSVASSLPPQVQGALTMAEAEQASLLGELATTRGPAGASSMTDKGVDAGSSIEHNKVKEIRTWIKGIRDAGYNILGLAAIRLGEGFFVDTDGRPAAMATALLENIEHMELHHIRQLLHLVVIPVVKVCPANLWDPWLRLLLPPILIHCHRVLSISWTSLIKEGALNIPSNWSLNTDVSNQSSMQQIQSEVMKEKLLRDLTRETCQLLSTAASPTHNRATQQDASEGDGGSMEVVGTQQLNKMNNLVWFLLQLREAATAALHVGIDALEWPDSESVHKAFVFCAAVTNVATLSGDSQLQEVVAKDMFSSAIRALMLESNASAQSELVGLLRDIYLQIGSRLSTPRQTACLPLKLRCIKLQVPRSSASLSSHFYSLLEETS